MKYNIPTWVIHVLLWLCISWVVISGYSIQSHEIELVDGKESVRIVRSGTLAWQLASILLGSVFLFYLNAFILLKRNRFRIDRQSFLFSFLLLMSALGITWSGGKVLAMNELLVLPGQISMGLVIFIYALSMAYSIFKLWYRDAQWRQARLIEENRAELLILRQQLQPHFLFNALNNLLSMVDRAGNTRLVQSLEKLSELLRYVTDQEGMEKVPLEKEIRFIRNYADLQLLRFSDNEVQADIRVEGDPSGILIEPGLFIDFVENAFKYGTEPEAAKCIDILFDLKQRSYIIFRVENEICRSSEKGGGTGLKRTAQRLRLLYPDRHVLNVKRENEQHIVELKIHPE